MLLRIVAKQVTDPELLWLAETVVRSHPTDNYRKQGDLSLFDRVPPHKSLFHTPKTAGLPIGNLTSQFFANLYLNELDRFVTEELGSTRYVRYVDDFILLDGSADRLRQHREDISAFLRDKLRLRLHPVKQHIDTCRFGIDFVGYQVFPDHLLSRRRVVRSLRRVLREADVRCAAGPPSREDLNHWLRQINAYYSHLVHASTFTLRQQIWRRDFGRLQEFCIPSDSDYTKIVPRTGKH